MKKKQIQREKKNTEKNITDSTNVDIVKSNI